MNRKCTSLQSNEQVVFKIHSDIYGKKIQMDGSVISVEEKRPTGYKCYDWSGNRIGPEINDIKTAVQFAMDNGCEVYDKNGEILFSQWDGWNGDYPNIKNICFPVEAKI